MVIGGCVLRHRVLNYLQLISLLVDSISLPTVSRMPGNATKKYVFRDGKTGRVGAPAEDHGFFIFWAARI